MMDTVESPTGSQDQRGRRDTLLGVVVSDKGEKTIHVQHEYQVRHPKYGKYYRRSTTLHAHDEGGEAKVGDLVELMACRRISKTKCWRLLRVVRPAAMMAG
jgi:small subunit ribosomal protein S17